MKLKFKQKLFLYLLLIFALFTICIIVFEQKREGKFKTDELREKLNIYTELIQPRLLGNDFQNLDTLIKTFPDTIRVTIIDKNGNVCYDNVISEISSLENHLNRPEIVEAKKQGTGMNIRTSQSNNKEYLYYAKKFNNYFIRAALPYNIQTQNFLKADNLFLYFIVVLFIAMLLFIHLVIESYDKSVEQYKDHKYRQEITGNIAHELRTPVTGIRGYLETVLEKQLDREKEKYFIKQAYDQTVILSDLIRDMSLITKIEEAPTSFQLTSVCINELLYGLKNDLQVIMQEKGIEMEWDIPENLAIFGNSNLLYSIFRNLADNVISYAGENVHIQISGFQDKQYCHFYFSDDGVGISDEKHLSRLFERFYRIGEGRTRDSGGSGLGLSIVKNAVIFHKGNIRARNKETGGLEFLFTLKNII
ncbi:MAG: HAMP domain-containing histidine kinase [Paludibacter sp.]|nr:HAMP domain-containing histidine kinase [Paludibacter sp.]